MASSLSSSSSSSSSSSETRPLLERQEPNQTNEENTAHHSTFARNLSARDGFALLVSIVMGSGIFSSPGPVDAAVPSPGAGLSIWLVGGLLAWTGALTMAELGTAFPGEGGIQAYLARVYGDGVGYMAAWSWMVATMPATLGILSIVFVESVFSCFGVRDSSSSVSHKVASCGVLVCVSVLNSISTRTSTRLSGFFVAVKLFTILLLIVAGLLVVFVYIGKGKDWGGGEWHSKGWFEQRDTVLPDGSKYGMIPCVLCNPTQSLDGYTKAIDSATTATCSRHGRTSSSWHAPSELGMWLVADWSGSHSNDDAIHHGKQWMIRPLRGTAGSVRSSGWAIARERFDDPLKCDCDERGWRKRRHVQVLDVIGIG